MNAHIGRDAKTFAYLVRALVAPRNEWQAYGFHVSFPWVHLYRTLFSFSLKLEPSSTCLFLDVRRRFTRKKRSRNDIQLADVRRECVTGQPGKFLRFMLPMDNVVGGILRAGTMLQHMNRPALYRVFEESVLPCATGLCKKRLSIKFRATNEKGRSTKQAIDVIHTHLHIVQTFDQFATFDMEG